MTDKVAIKFVPVLPTIVFINDTEVEIIPFLTLSQQAYLIDKYVEEYFTHTEDSLIQSSKYNYLEAEINQINYICQLCTNIDTESLTQEFLTDNLFLQTITSNIKNYPDFKYKLYNVLTQIKEQTIIENSLGKVISDLVTKAHGLLDKISNITPEEIEKIKTSSLELLEKIEKSSIIKDMETKS